MLISSTPQIYNQSQSTRRSVNKCIMGNKQSFSLFPHNPRMIPAGVTPTLHKMDITCGQFEAKESSRRSGNGRHSLSIRRLSLLNPDAQGMAWTAYGFIVTCRLIQTFFFNKMVRPKYFF